MRAGVYGQAVLGYKEFLFMTLNGRNDWVSTLEENNRTLFYPGISGAFIPTSAIEALKHSSALNYLKIRLGYGTSAHFPTPYNTRASLNLTTNAFIDPNGNVINTASIPNQVPNPNLKPELLREVEAGIEGRFFDNRINLDLTGYSRSAKNQILNRQLDGLYRLHFNHNQCRRGGQQGNRDEFGSGDSAHKRLEMGGKRDIYLKQEQS